MKNKHSTRIAWNYIFVDKIRRVINSTNEDLKDL